MEAMAIFIFINSELAKNSISISFSFFFSKMARLSVTVFLISPEELKKDFKTNDLKLFQ
jgi:hypothetical protein